MNFRVLVHLFLVYILQTIDRLASHLQNHLPREAKVKIQNIAIEYVKCQVCILLTQAIHLKTSTLIELDSPTEHLSVGEPRVAKCANFKGVWVKSQS